MNRKLLFSLFVFGVVIFSLSSASAFWPFDSGTDVTVNGVNFHLPDGFDDVEQENIDSVNYNEAFSYKNNENYEFIKIAVMDFDGDANSLYSSLSNKGYQKEVIDGKEGYGMVFPGGPRYGYCYLDNNKYVVLDIPYVYAEEAMQHDELLAEIIK